jgi:hypothetical protein
MRLQGNYLTPVFFGLWSCVAVVAIWRFQIGQNDASAALTAAVVLLTSLMFSKIVLGLSFDTAPMLYLALSGLFHLGVVVPWALGIYDISHTPGFSPHGLSRALGLITYSIVVYQVGLFVALRGGKYQWIATPEGGQKLENSGIFAAGSLLFLAGAAMFVIGVIQLESISYGRLTYSETFRLRAESDPRFFGTGVIVAFIGLCLTAAGAPRRLMRVTYVYVGLWLSALFYLGFRCPALTGALLVYIVALKKGIRFPKWGPWAAVGLLLVTVPIVRIVREEPLDLQSLGTSLREINLLDGPAEVGSAIRPLAETIDIIGPGTYRYGRTYLAAIRGIFPNLALRWEAPTTGSVDDLPPDHWITAIVDPWSYKNHEGIGFSGIAEPYMNFGIAGVVVFFFVLAVLLVRLDQVSIRTPYGLASWALVIGPLLWTTRNDFAEFFRPVVWGLLCLASIPVFSFGYNLIRRPARRDVTNAKARMRTVRQV